MKKEDLFRAIGAADETLLEHSEQTARRTKPWKKWTAAAACLCAAAGIFYLASHLPDPGSGGAGIGTSDDSFQGTSGLSSYAGPVMPLTLLEPPDGISAARDVTFDLAPYKTAEGYIARFGIDVTDRYTLTNHTDSAQTVTAVYPFAASCNTLKKSLPNITVNGKNVQAELHAGAYSGTFMENTVNSQELRSWEKYKSLLEDRTYLEDALHSAPDLSIPVIVYECSTSDEKQTAQYPTMKLWFKASSNSKVLTYALDSAEYTQNGSIREYNCSLSPAGSGEPLPMVIVAGEDIDSYTVRDSSDPDSQNPSSKIVRRESTLGGILTEIVESQRDTMTYLDFETGENYDGIPQTVTTEMLCQAAAELLLQYGALSDNPTEDYADGDLRTILDEAFYQGRIPYLTFTLTVPAGQSVVVQATMFKPASFYYLDSGKVDIHYYDMVTKLGSNLTFEQITANIKNRGRRLYSETFGFHQADKVTLDPNQEHYQMEIHS